MVWPKMAIFPIGSFWANPARKDRFFYIRDRKESFLDKKGQLLIKSKKSKFSKGISPWVLAKNGHFFICGFWANPVRKDRFLIFLEENNAF